MTIRELPPAEWPRLSDSPLGALVAAQPAGAVLPIVTEDAGGAIVGTIGLVPLLHAEGLWIDPAHRGKGAAFRSFLRAMQMARARYGVQGVVISTRLERTATRLGARPLPPTFYWP